MTISKKRELLISHLDEHLALLQKSVIALDYSYDKCRALGEKEEYDLEQQESFEALASRFARTSDILTQKVLKSLFILLQENTKTIIDTANLLEKLAVLESADDLLNVRELRNQIAHEDVESDVKALFFDVLRYVPEIKKIINNVTEYYQKHLALPEPDSQIK